MRIVFALYSQLMNHLAGREHVLPFAGNQSGQRAAKVLEGDE